MKTQRTRTICLGLILAVWIICMIFNSDRRWSNTILALWYGFAIAISPACNYRQYLFLSTFGAGLYFTPMLGIN